MKKLENLEVSNSFAKLGADFFQEKLPEPVPSPYLIDSNPAAIKLIGLDIAEVKKNEFLEYFSGNRLLPNSKPLAMAYSGHQFGSYNPRLGDGRGLLLGEVKDQYNNTLDIHLKGCGPTRFSRGFDGRATLRASIREYLGGEAVHGLGIPTTRSIAVIGTGELVHRETPEPGAILVRLCDSHIRFGSFQLLHFTNKSNQVTELLNYTIKRHYPTIQNDSDKVQLLLRHVVKRTAKLIALWQANGFIHGVMNTDNMTITGTTFDYGPFGFMDRFNPNFTPNHSDPNGLMFSLNLYSKEQELATQCAEINEIYQDLGLPKSQKYKIRVSPAFPIVGDQENITLPIRDYPKVGRMMINLLKEYPQLCFRFDCSFPPCFLDEIQEDEYPLVERIFYHGNQPVPNIQDWETSDLNLGCSDDSPMDIDPQGDCFNCFPFHNLKLGNITDFKEVNDLSIKKMHTKFLSHAFGAEPNEPCKSCPHYMVRCSSGCFAYNFA